MASRIVSAEDALASAWAVAGRVAEREMVPDGYVAIGPAALETLQAEAAASGHPLLAELIADSDAFRSGALRATRPPVLSPWSDRFLGVEISCRTAIAIEIERLLGTPDAGRLAELARAQGRVALAELLAEGLNFDAPALGDSSPDF